MVAVVLIGAMLIGGVIGMVSRRGRPVRRTPPRVLDSDNTDVQAGFRNTYGGP